MAVYDKIAAIELPDDVDTKDWTDEDWDKRIKEGNEKEALMKEEGRAEEEGWDALPFSPELRPLSSGAFLASSVEYSWPGYVPRWWDEEAIYEELFKVSKVVKIVKVGSTWQLVDFWGDEEYLLLTGEGDSVVRSGLTSMRILMSGELLLTRKSFIPGSDFKGATYTLYSPI